MSFTVSAALTGLGGALFATQNAFIAPSIFAFDLSILMLLFVILGGLGTVWGPLVGTAFLLILPELIAGFTHIRLVIYGAVMLGCLYFMPQGIAGFFEGKLERRRRREKPLQAPDTEGMVAAVAARQANGAETSLVEIESITKSFGGLVALEDLTLDIERGTIHSVIGPNGAGKTTLINVMSGFYKSDSGKFHFGGAAVDRYSAHRMAAQGIARTFQATRLFPHMTVLENVMVGMHRHLGAGLAAALFSMPSIKGDERQAEAQALAALEIVGYVGDPHETADNLAFGHKRLVEIARALSSRPLLLLLDEPAAGLTAGEIEELDMLITKIRDMGVTVLLVEHHMDLVMEISDRVTVLDYGRKIAEGSPEVVRADPLVVEAYLGHDE
jgi:ABC-type branched-subunit amino acid transport system ATPase component